MFSLTLSPPSLNTLLSFFTLFFPSHKTTWRRQQASSPSPPSSLERRRHYQSLLSLPPPLSGSCALHAPYPSLSCRSRPPPPHGSPKSCRRRCIPCRRGKSYLRAVFKFRLFEEDECVTVVDCSPS